MKNLISDAASSFILKESLLEPIPTGSSEFKIYLKQISFELNSGRSVITVLNNQVIRISMQNNDIKIEPINN